MKERQTYKIPMHDYDPELMEKLIKEWETNTHISLIPEEDKSFFKCPFRSDKHGNFLPCYELNCMAFRQDARRFWCARLEPPKGDYDTLHSIDLLNEDDDW